MANYNAFSFNWPTTYFADQRYIRSEATNLVSIGGTSSTTTYYYRTSGGSLSSTTSLSGVPSTATIIATVTS